MNLIDTSTAVWNRAKKTKPLRAKPMVSLLVDKTVMTKFLLDTLEAREPISPNTLFCIGEAGDAWQQTPDKMLKKYDVVNIDTEGWMICNPKPENEVHFFELTPDKYSAPYGSELYIRGLWGEEINGEKNIQRCLPGDFVCRQPHDYNDQWVVRRKLFLNTYVVIGN